MAKIILAWELGGGLGHIARLRLLAEKLLGNGHKIIFVLPDPNILQRFSITSASGSPVVHKAPESLKTNKKLSRNPDNFSEILLSLHYYNTKELQNLIKQWQNLFIHIKPDLICFDSAPTAILATRIINTSRDIEKKIKTVNIGQYYFTPADTHPQPSFTYNRRVSNKALIQSDRLLIKNIYEVLNHIHGTETSHEKETIHTLLKTDLSIITSIPELDFHAKHRPINQLYSGSFISSTLGERALTWSNRKGKKRVFGYLKASYKGLLIFLEALKEQNVEARIYLSGLTNTDFKSQLLKLHTDGDFEISLSPYKIGSSLELADALICHSGSSILYSLSYGKPILTIPLQREQFMTAQCCIDAGFGVGLNPNETDKVKINKALHTLLNMQALTTSAIKLKNAYQNSSLEQAKIFIFGKIEKLLAE